MVEGFDDKSVVSLMLVVENRYEVTLGTISSYQGPTYEWQWTVSDLLPAEHYVAIKAYQPFSTNGDKVAYTPQIMVHAQPFESSFSSFVEGLSPSLDQQSVIHPALSAAFDRLRHLLTTSPIRGNGGYGHHQRKSSKMKRRNKKKKQ